MLDQILTLINAGFKAPEIMQILNAENTPAAPADSSAAPAAPAISPAPAAAPAANEQPPASAAPAAPAAPGIDGGAINAAIEQMGRNIIAALQKAQIGGTSAPAPADPMAQIDAITAQIINPTYKKGE